MQELQLTNNWFDVTARTNWDLLIPQIKPKRVLEIGSYEGASTCYLIDKLSVEHEVEIHCVDTWEGALEHKAGGSFATDMKLVENRFKNNIRVASQNAKNKIECVIHKESSDVCLPKLISEGKMNYFDFIYIDGSHQASDVLFDAVLSFKLLKIGGVIAFDDYKYAGEMPYGKDLLCCPKPAIDAFVNLNFRKLNIIFAPLSQFYIQKTAN